MGGYVTQEPAGTELEVQEKRRKQRGKRGRKS
jgi:hypothetical protein